MNDCSATEARFQMFPTDLDEHLLCRFLKEQVSIENVLWEKYSFELPAQKISDTGSQVSFHSCWTSAFSLEEFWHSQKDARIGSD